MSTATDRPVLAALRGDPSPLRPGPRVLAPETVEGIHRARLVAGMAEAAAEKGYAATTVADVVRRARVSRRTFYEHFADKEECFLAAYEATSELLMAVVAEAVVAQDVPWPERIAAGVSTYLRTLAGEPELTRVFLLDVLAVGPAAIRRRREVHQRFADVVVDLVERHRDELPPGYRLQPAMAVAVIGAVNELVLLAVDEGRTAELPALEQTATGLLHAVLAASSTEVA